MKILQEQYIDFSQDLSNQAKVIRQVEDPWLLREF